MCGGSASFTHRAYKARFRGPFNSTLGVALSSSQYMPIPEKDFFTLDEIIERWRYSGADDATLLKLATEDLLVFSVYIRDLGSHQVTRETPQGCVTTKHTVELSFRAEGYSRPPLQYLGAEDARRILESHPGERIAVRGHYSLPSRTKESGLGHATAPHFARSDLLVSRLERDRFEKEHKVRIRPPWPSRVWKWLTDQANHRALTMLSGWIAAALAAAWALWVWWYQLPPAPPATPNPSLNRSSNGTPPSPVWRYAVHFRQPGLGVLPLPPG